jgi:hypothetical protein
MICLINSVVCVFSKIDFQSGYHQLKTRDYDILKTAFILRNGLYGHMLKSFGLTNASTNYMDLLNKEFMEYLDKLFMVFINDVSVGPMDEEHICLVLVLTNMENNGNTRDIRV